MNPYDEYGVAVTEVGAGLAWVVESWRTSLARGVDKAPGSQAYHWIRYPETLRGHSFSLLILLSVVTCFLHSAPLLEQHRRP